MSMSRLIRWCVFVAQCLIFQGMVRPAAAAAPQDWDSVRPLLEANAGALSPVTIEWDRQSKSPLDESTWDSRVNSWRPQWDMLAPEKVTLSLQGNRFYFLRRYHQARLDDNPDRVAVAPGKQLNDLTMENAFDGESVYTGSGPTTKFQTSGLTIDKPDVMRNRQPDYPYMTASYFNYAGLKLPEFAAEVGRAPQSLLVYLLDGGGALVGVVAERFEGAECAKATIDHDKRRYEFYLDPTLNYAVRGRAETDESGRRMRTVTNAEFQQFRPGLWLPMRVDVEFLCGMEFGKPEQTFDRPIYSSTYRGHDVSGSPIPNERFSLNYTAPGTIIADGRLPGAYEEGRERIQYMIPADARRLDEVVETAMGVTPSKPERRTAWYGTLAAAALAFAAVAGCLLILRKRRIKGATR
jgi:hypothetical protein